MNINKQLELKKKSLKGGIKSELGYYKEILKELNNNVKE